MEAKYLLKQRRKETAFASYAEICKHFLSRKKEGVYSSKSLTMTDVAESFNAFYEGNRNKTLKVKSRIEKLVSIGFLLRTGIGTRGKPFMHELDIPFYFKALEGGRTKYEVKKVKEVENEA